MELWQKLKELLWRGTLIQGNGDWDQLYVLNQQFYSTVIYNVILFKQATLKKKLIKDGLLDEKGKPNNKTPKDWYLKYQDYKHSSEVQSSSSKAKQERDDDDDDDDDQPNESSLNGSKMSVEQAAEREDVSSEKKKKKKKKKKKEEVKKESSDSDSSD